jgi:hypothetical protein
MTADGGNGSRGKKRLRPTTVTTTDDVLHKAREIWSRNPDKSWSVETKDRK